MSGEITDQTFRDGDRERVYSTSARLEVRAQLTATLPDCQLVGRFWITGLVAE